MRAHEKKMVSTTARSRRMQQMVVQSAGGLKMILVSSTVVVLLLLLLTGSCCAQSEDQANAYLDEVEKEVMQIAAQASVNFLNTCDLVASCGGVANCSRQACVPLQDDEASYTCKQVVNNTNCDNLQGTLGCVRERVSLGRSFVRIPTQTETLSEANASICSQRMLDPVLMNISQQYNNNLNLTSWTYFASVEGVHRAFPGRDVPANNCTFEPRLRPWYMGATAVKKDVMVLLDAGVSMGFNLPNDLEVTAGTTTMFSAAISIISVFLDTLIDSNDRVTIITFNSSTANYVLQPMTVNSTSVQLLKTELQSLNPDNLQGSSNLLAAFLLANQSFHAPLGYALQVILTFTDGQILSLTENTSGLFSSIRMQQMLVQIFSFDRSTDASTMLSQVACSCNGTYEQILETIDNPLWTLRSYFGILANLRLQALSYLPYWTTPYLDDGSLGMVITVAYPAFDSDNYTLIGVAGIDILLQDVGLANLAGALPYHKNTNPVFNLSLVTPLPCKFKLSTLNQCPGVSPPVDTLCTQTDTSGQTFQERVCNCPGMCLVPVEPHHSLKSSEISAIAIGGASLIVIIMLIVLLTCRRCKGLLANHGQDQSLTNPPYSDSPVSPMKSSYKGMLELSARSKSEGWGSHAIKDLAEYTEDELCEATGNWSEESVLGKGAHGKVYKGNLSDGTVVAIKKPMMNNVDKSLWDTFSRELELLSKLNHKRLVRLRGYCKDEIILVYEFMQNGTLAECLHPDEKQGVPRLGWGERLRIAAGAAKGLEYLHEYAVPKIYHGDVKPANILLDQNLDAHVSDFGLSIWSRDEKNSYMVASHMGGTFGYLDPEYVTSGQPTFASDVYSFGIVLLELMSSRHVVVDGENIKDWAAHLVEQGEIEKIIDSITIGEPTNISVLISIIHLALECVERRKQDRPKMLAVSTRLDQAYSTWRSSSENNEYSILSPR
ncbi:unnamed protein product [Sphagnum balticum]